MRSEKHVGQGMASGPSLIHGGVRRPRRCVEDGLAEQLRLLKSVIDGVSVALFILDERQRCRFMNPAAEQLTGYRVDEAQGHPLHDVVHYTKPGERHYPLAECSIDRASPENNHMKGEEIFVHRDGHCYPIAFTASPIRDKAGKPVGMIIEVNGTERSQTEHGLREAQVRLRAMANELNLAEQRERKRLANELHDHLQQMLVVGKLTIGQGMRSSRGLPECEMVLKKLDDILSDALTYSRTLVAELSPPVLHNLGLAAGLKWLVEYMKKKYEQAVTVVVSEGQALKLPEEHASLLFQSVRELLINSSKHAGTKEATVRMEQRDEQLQIEVRDEGAGFDLAATMPGMFSGGISSGFGLLSIQERLQALGGSFTIDSALGQGTTARLSLRLARNGKVADCDSGSPDRESRPAPMAPAVLR